jgi:hypothetical protein
MATLKKMTRVGADVRQIARLLQAKAPENHMLAYITPEEAQLLKDRGGSGKTHADTGIPSFEYDAEQYYSQLDESTAPEIRDLPSFSSSENTAAFAYPSGFDAPVGTDRFAGAYQGAPVDSYLPVSQTRISEGEFKSPSGVTLYGSQSQLPTYSAVSNFPELPPVDIRDTQAKPFDTAPSKTIGERYSDLAKNLGVKEDTLARLGLGGLQAALGARQARLAKEEAQKAKEEQQKIAAPYQTKGAELQRQAQAGELTPVARQQLQAAQAQAAQSASARGGVGAQQTAARVEALRGQLLQQQYDYGLKLSGIGDQLALGAIRTGLEADRYVNQLSNTYYTNIARTLVGAPTVVQYGVTQ